MGHEASRAHFGHAAPLAEEKRRHLLGTRLPGQTFGHAAPLAEEKRRHLLGTRLPGHTLVTPRLLRKRKGGTFRAQGFQGTIWSRCASCRREKAAPFGHEASAPHSLTKTAGNVTKVCPQEPKRFFRVTAPRPLRELSKTARTVTEACRPKRRNASKA